MKYLFITLTVSLILIFPSCKKEEIEEPTPPIGELSLLKSVQIENLAFCTFKYDNNDRLNFFGMRHPTNGNWEEHDIIYLPDGRIDSVINRVHNPGYTDEKYMTFVYSQDGLSVMLLDHFINGWSQPIDTSYFELNEDKSVKSYTLPEWQGVRFDHYYSNENRVRYDWQGATPIRYLSYYFDFNNESNPLFFNNDVLLFFHIPSQIYFLRSFLYSKNLPISYTTVDHLTTFEYSYNDQNQPIHAIESIANSTTQGNYYFEYY